MRRRAAGWLVLACVLGAACLSACGRGAARPAPAPDEPLGRWKLDRDALLKDVAEAHKDDGAAVVAREQDLARGVSIDMEIRGDGVYAYRTVALGEQEYCLGTWRRDGKRLLFTPVKRNDERLTDAKPEEAEFEDGRIVVRFANKTFTLVRHTPE